MTEIPLGQGYFVDTNTGKTYTKTGGGYFAGQEAADLELDRRAAPTTPSIPAIGPSINVSSIKIATPDIMIGKDEVVPIEIMTNLIFEDIGGQEIINISRADLVNGQKVVYQPIKNLADIDSQYNSKNILSLENTSETVFNNFPIRLDIHIPVVGNGPNGIPVYIDSVNGNLVVDVINMAAGEQVEVQILNSGILLDDTIY
jgi:hypothetical protein